MKTEASDIFSNIFEDKPFNISEHNVKDTIKKNLQLFEEQTIQLSDYYFQNWSGNLLHLTNEILFDTSVHYFSIFTKVIEIIPSYFPSDSQIFLYIVQSFLTNIIKNNELMKNFCLSFCFKLQIMICSNNITIDFSQINLVISIFKSFHIVDIILEVIEQYPFNFSKDINLDPSKDVISYTEIAFVRYLITQKIIYHILDSTNVKGQQYNTSLLQDILHKVFNQLITAKINVLTIDVNPPLGKLLPTPFLSWICEEFKIQKKEQDENDKQSTNNYKFNLSQLYEACSSYIYDEILKFSRGKNDDIGHILFIIENLSLHYSHIFESIPGAMNYLESSIREALNDSRMKFDYNLAFYIDNLISNSFLLGNSFWKNFIAKPPKEENDEHHHHCDCCCKTMFGDDESMARSAFLHAVTRIENKSKFCAYFTNSINSLTAAHGPGIAQLIKPIFDIIQLVTNSDIINLASEHSYEPHYHRCECYCSHHHHHHPQAEASASIDNNNNNNNNDSNNNNNAHVNEKRVSFADGCANNEKNAPIHNVDNNLCVEAHLIFNGDEIPVFCDYLTYQILSAIIEHNGCTLDEINDLVKGNSDDIENRVVTLSDYLLRLNDDDKYTFDSSYRPEHDFIRIAPFYESMEGEIPPKRRVLIKSKVLAAIQTKGHEKLDFFVYDSFLMLNRKVRPDTAMILDIIDELVSDGSISLENGMVKYIKDNDDDEKKDEK